MDIVDDVVKEPEVVEDKETLQQKPDNAKNKSEKTKEEKVSFLTHIKEKFHSLWSKKKEVKTEKQPLTDDDLEMIRREQEAIEKNKGKEDFEWDPANPPKEFMEKWEKMSDREKFKFKNGYYPPEKNQR